VKIPKSQAGRAAILLGVLLILIGAAVGGALALDLGPWADREEEVDDTTPFVPTARQGGTVIARVDGVPIYLSQAESRIEGLESMHGSVEETLGEDWPETVLQSLVDDVVIVAEADARGIIITEGDIARSLARIRGMVETEEDLEQWLEDQGTTLPELEQRIYLQMLAARVYLAVTEDVSVTAAELREYYRDHKDEFRTPEGWVKPFFTQREALEESMLKERQDQAYAAWLEEARAQVEVDVVEQAWWRDLG